MALSGIEGAAVKPGSGDPRDDPLLLYGPHPERKSPLLIQIVSPLLVIGVHSRRLLAIRLNDAQTWEKGESTIR